MTCLSAARSRLQAAGDLSSILDAAYVAFENMLAVIRPHQELGSVAFVPFMMASMCAANSRDAILFAPSMPPRPLAAPSAMGECHPEEVPAVARELVDLCQLLEAKLTGATNGGSEPRDRSACLDAAAQARELRSYISGCVP